MATRRTIQPTITARALGFALLAAAAGVGDSAADPITVGGLTFSDELGGMVLLEVSGRGTLDDPFVVVERLTSPDGATLVVRGLTGHRANLVGSQHAFGFALRKVVVNGTKDTWPSFEVELQEVLGRPSDHEDGLSFGQGTEQGKPFRAAPFARTLDIEDPLDGVRFGDGGLVAPEQSVTLDVIVTEMTATEEFYVLQRPVRPVASAEPGIQVAARGDGTLPGIGFLAP